MLVRNTLTVVASFGLLIAACQEDSGDATSGGGGGIPILPTVTSGGPGGPGPSTGTTGPTTTTQQGSGGNPAGTGGNGGSGPGAGGGGGGCVGTPPGMGDLVFNELHTSPDANADDTNCDGTTSSTNDEFIEVANATNTTLDLTNVQLKENGTLQHTFSGCLPMKQAIVIYRSTATPMCDATDWGTTLGVSATVNIGLSNTGGEVFTLELGATELDTVTTLNLGGTNPRTSMTRNPDVTGAFVQHTSVNASPFSVGTCVDGSFFPCN